MGDEIELSGLTESDMESYVQGAERISMMTLTDPETELVVGEIAVQLATVWEQLIDYRESLVKLADLVSAISEDPGGGVAIKVGAASIALKPDGSIEIRGSRIKVVGSQDVSITGQRMAPNQRPGAQGVAGVVEGMVVPPL